MISVIIVEDQTLVREGMIRLLEFSNTVKAIGSASNGDEALRLCESLQPDVVLVDIQMPGMDGFSFIRHHSRQHPKTRYIVLTTFGDQHYLAAAQEVGAHAFLLKDVSFTQLVSSIEQVAAGASLMPESRPLTIPPSSSKVQLLTAREQEIFTQIAQGYSNKEIALQLSVSEGTIKNHVSNILSKLGVRDRTQAVIKYKNG